MLTVVDDFAGAGMFVRRSASAEIGAALEESDAKSGVGESASGGEAGEAATGDGYGGLGRGWAHELVRHGTDAAKNSRFLTGPSARFGMTRI